MSNKKIKSNYFSNANIGLNKKIRFIYKHSIMNFEIKRISFKYLFYMIFIVSILNTSNKNMNRELFNVLKSYEIKIKIKGIGNQNIISSNYYNCPNKILLNEQLINYIIDCHIINIPSQESNETIINNVTLIWDQSTNSFDSMFYYLQNISEVDLSNYDASLITSMNHVFVGCISLTSINLNNLNTSSVESISHIFENCNSLKELDLSSFNTSSVKHMDYAFFNCYSITYINLNNFDTSQTETMFGMFYNCNKLQNLDLKSFDTSKVTDMSSMFSWCAGLTNIDLSSFNTSSVEKMDFMFYYNYALPSLNLSHFNTSKVTSMSNMFGLCMFLTSLDVSNFDTSQVTSMSYMFSGCSSLSSINVSNFDTSKAISMSYMFSECASLTSLDISNFNTSLVKQMQQMFFGSINLGYINLYNFDENNLNGYTYYYQNMFNKIPENVVVCIIRNFTEMKIFPQITKKKCYVVDCTDDWKSKKKKLIADTNDCVENCSVIPQYKYEYNGICYENCTHYYYINEENNYFCTINSSCPEEYPNLNKNKRECTKYNLNNMIQNMLKTERNETEKISKEEEIKFNDNILKSIEEGFISENYDTSNLDKGEDEIIKTEKMTITFTTSQNQKDNKNNNMSTIDLGECETLLRNYYNLSMNETLYMKKIDVVQEGMKSTKVEYDVYSKLNGNNLVKLNLTVCGSTKISISIPFIIDEGLDKLNMSSGYYNDICYTTTSEDGTDISLKDRQTEFIDKDKVVCQEDCDFSEYDYETFKAKCSCEVKETPASVADMNINKAKLL